MLKSERDAAVMRVVETLRASQRVNKLDVVTSVQLSLTDNGGEGNQVFWEATEFIRERDGIVWVPVKGYPYEYQRADCMQALANAQRQRAAANRKYKRAADKQRAAVELATDAGDKERASREAARSIMQLEAMRTRGRWKV